MAKDALVIAGIPLKPAGTDDSTPINLEENYFLTRGVRTLSEKCVERLTGKLLIEKYDVPVLGIHGSIGNQYYVETVDQLILYNGFGIAGGGGPPDPLPVFTDLVLWLEADSLSLSDNDPVALWDDQGTFGNDVVQASGGQQPLFKSTILNGLPVIRFDGSDDTLVRAGSTDFAFKNATIFVIRNNAGNDPAISIAIPGSVGEEFLFLFNDAFHHSSSGSFTRRTHQTTPGGYFLQTTKFGESENDLDVWIDGVASTDSLASSGSPGPFIVTNRDVYLAFRNEVVPNFGAMDIAAVLVYKSLLSDVNRQTVETYLMDKYGL